MNSIAPCALVACMCVCECLCTVHSVCMQSTPFQPHRTTKMNKILKSILWREKKMPMEKAMNIKIKINHRRTSAMEDDEKKRVIIFSCLDCFGVIYVDLWKLWYSLGKRWNAQEMRAEYISTEWKVTAFIVRHFHRIFYCQPIQRKKTRTMYKNWFESQLGICIYIQ